MTNRRGRRRFGFVRKLKSGHYQASYVAPDGRRRYAPEAFPRKADADRWLAKMDEQLVHGEWVDPARGKVTVGEYAERWLRERPGLRPLTVQLYRRLLRKYIRPSLGPVAVGRLNPALIREWRANLLAAGVSVTIAAKAYRLLRAILTTAVNEDRLIPRNPCRIRGADKETPEERPVLTVAQVVGLADLMPHPRFRTLILVAAFCSLRWGEVTALRRADVAEDGSWVRVSSQFIDLPGDGLIRTPPKSRAGVRTVAVPAAIRVDLLRHLATEVKSAGDALLFTMLRGGPMRRGNFNPATNWKANVAKVGVPTLRFHDLRHTGNTLAASTGTSLRDLMTRMGHDSPRAALIYQHITSTADQLIADRLSALLDAHNEARDVGDDPAGDDEEGDDGAAGSLVPAG